MKIVIYHPFPNSAESEVARRYIIAGKKLGIEIFETGDPSEIERQNPDFALSLSIFSPKAFSQPSYHVINNPIPYYKPNDYIDEQYSHLMKALLTHDGYLGISDIMKNFIEDVAFGMRKKFFYESNFANTVPKTPFKELDYSNAKLAYFGSNWDKKEGGLRFGKIFQNLMKRNAEIQFYGKAKSWKHIKRKFYGGSALLDGIDVLSKYRENGIGIALNRENFFEHNLPTSRIFEITASSTICISDKMPFVLENFKDTVLYIEKGDSKEVALQIIDHQSWARSNQKRATEMTFEANKIFNDKFSLEVMLEKAISFHEKVKKAKFYTESFSFLEEKEKVPLVTIIMRTGGRGIDIIRKTIDSIANQSYKRIQLIVSFYRLNNEVKEFILNQKNRFESIKIIENFSNLRSTPMFSALKYIEGEYFGFVDDDDTIFSNHISLLLEGFQNTLNKDIGLIYAGGFDYYNDLKFTSKKRQQILGKNLKYDIASAIPIKTNIAMYRFAPIEEDKFYTDFATIASNSYLVKTNMLRSFILEDPKMKTAEDYYFLLMLSQVCHFSFISEITNRYNHIITNTDQSKIDFNEKEILHSRGILMRRLFGFSKPFHFLQYIKYSDYTHGKEISKSRNRYKRLKNLFIFLIIMTIINIILTIFIIIK